jgi:hypothetical protein
LPVAEAYLRGSDLVASYTARDDWPFSPQIYWCADTVEPMPGLAGSLSLIVSVQTHLLDTWPRIVVTSRLACEEMLAVSPGGSRHVRPLSPARHETLRPTGEACCIIWRLSELPFSYAEIVPAGDCRALRLWRDDAGECRAEWELLADFLEKGVIRRARLHSAFLARENDIESALAYCEAVQQRPLPLTT